MDVIKRINKGMKYTRTQYLRAIVWRFGMSRREAITTYDELVTNRNQLFLNNCVYDYANRAIQVPILKKRR